MWILTQTGQLVNLDRCTAIRLDGSRIVADGGAEEQRLAVYDDPAFAEKVWEAMEGLATTSMAAYENKAKKQSEDAEPEQNKRSLAERVTGREPKPSTPQGTVD